MTPIFNILAETTPWWNAILQRCVDEMSPAYLVFVGILVVAVKLGYDYLSQKIKNSAAKEEAFLALMQNTLDVIKELDETLLALRARVDQLHADHDDLKQKLDNEPD